MTDQDDHEQDPPAPKVADQKEGCGTDSPPKNKRPKSSEPGETAAPPATVDWEVTCTIDDPGEDWRFKCYINFLHTELELNFTTTRFRREY